MTAFVVRARRGWYELVAILTHKGQNADGGHYVAWVQHKGDQWVCFDDQKVTECRCVPTLVSLLALEGVVW